LTAEPGYLSFFAEVGKSQPVESVRDKLIALVEELGTRPVSGLEVRRFQYRARKEFVRQSADPEAVAEDLGHWAAVGDWRLRYLHRDRVERLNSEEVQSFAQRYLLTANRTVGLFLPMAQPLRSPLPGAPDAAALFSEPYQGREAPTPGETFATTIENIEARTSRLTLPNGMKVALLAKRSRGETIHIALRINAGTPQVLRGHGGQVDLLALLGPMLERGSKRHSFQQITDEMDRLGTDAVFPRPGVLRLPSLSEDIELETTRAHVVEVLALLAELLQESSFPKEQLEIVRKDLLTDAEGALQDPLQLAGTALLRRLFSYPADDPRYVPTVPERIARLQLVRGEDLRHFHQEYFGGTAAQLTVLGDFDPASITRAIETHFGAWRAPRAYERLLFPYVENPGAEETINVSDKQNAVVLAGQALELSDKDPDYPALSLFGFLLGGSDDARLKRRLREETGAAYAVEASVDASAFDKSGFFIAFFTCAPKNARASMQLMEREIADVVEHGPSPAELRAAQQAYKKAFDIELADEAGLARLLMNHLERDRTLRFDDEFLRRVAAVTPAEFLAAVRRHIVPERLVKIFSGDFPPAASTQVPEKAPEKKYPELPARGTVPSLGKPVAR
jgi:zinc protease